MGNIYTTRVNFKRKDSMGLDCFDDLVPRITRKPKAEFVKPLLKLSGWHRARFDMTLLRPDIDLRDVPAPPEEVFYLFQDDCLCLKLETPDAPPREWIAALPEVLGQFDFAGISRAPGESWSLQFVNDKSEGFTIRECSSPEDDVNARAFLAGSSESTMAFMDAHVRSLGQGTYEPSFSL